MNNHKNAAVLVCAGNGSRMKGACKDKLLLELAGKPVVVHTMLAYDR
ncbi:MAG: NTP transferase domain-containing protein, partial [Clostridia bacterium]|nr:NTP transferase domain-containing protein [Clostridia bacterium]